MKRPSKWQSLGERVAKLRAGESIVLQGEGDALEQAGKIHNGLTHVRACSFVRRTVKVVDGKILIKPWAAGR